MKTFMFDPTLPVLPLDNPAELESLLALIKEHIATETEFAALLQLHDDDTPEFAANGGDALSTKGEEGYWEIAGHPATALNTILLKGRYLAARHAAGELSFTHAVAFVASFLEYPDGRASL